MFLNQKRNPTTKNYITIKIFQVGADALPQVPIPEWCTSNP